jgi:hypothetical protein
MHSALLAKMKRSDKIKIPQGELDKALSELAAKAK